MGITCVECARVVVADIRGAAIGVAGLSLLSKLPKMVPQYIFMIKPSPWGQAIGEGLGEITKNSMVQTATGGAQRIAQNEMQEKWNQWRKKTSDVSSTDNKGNPPPQPAERPPRAPMV